MLACHNQNWIVRLDSTAMRTNSLSYHRLQRETAASHAATPKITAWIRRQLLWRKFVTVSDCLVISSHSSGIFTKYERHGSIGWLYFRISFEKFRFDVCFVRFFLSSQQASRRAEMSARLEANREVRRQEREAKRDQQENAVTDESRRRSAMDLFTQQFEAEKKGLSSSTS